MLEVSNVKSKKEPLAFWYDVGLDRSPLLGFFRSGGQKLFHGPVSAVEKRIHCPR